MIAGIAIVAVLVVAVIGWLLHRAALAQQALRRSEERFARAMEASDSGVWEWNPTTDRAFLSTRARQLLGIPEGQRIDTRADLMAHGGFHPEDVPRIEETLRASLAQSCEGLEVEYRVVDPAGQIRWVRSRGKTFCDAQGRPLLLVRSLTDITERKLAEKALRENEERFALAMSGSNQGIFDWDLATDQVFLSRRAQELCGLETEASWKLRDDWLAMLRYHPDDLEPQRRGLRSHLAGETPTYDIEYRLIQADGECRWLRQRGVALRDASGKVYRMAGSIEDVTERKLAGEALRDSEARFRSLTELSSDWYWRQDENLRFTYLSSQANDLTGYTGQSSIGKLRWELANMTPLSTTWPEHQAVLAARKPFRDLECRRIGPDGAARYLSMSGAPIFDDRGQFKGYHGIGRNITDRKCIEEELRARQDMLDLAQKAARAVAFEWRLGADEEDNRLSSDLEAMHGLAPGSPARLIYNWKKVVHPDDWPVVRAAIKAGQHSGDIAAEYRILQPDGAVKWLQAKGRMVLDTAGKPSAMVGFLFDVTERHHAEDELRRLERQLRQAQRLEAMGTLAGGIAHDFNNILGAVLGYGEMALRGATKGSRLRRDLDNIMTAGERGRSLVEQILAFSRSSANERVAVQLERVAGEALDHLAAHIPPNISVEPRLRAGDAAVMGDPTQVHQVVMNLAKNAFQAMPSGGTVRVLLEPVRIDTPRVITTGMLEPGDYVLLEVADDGVGIAPEIVDRIFDPFFTTKEVGLGTGLGLSLVHGIVTELGGAINVVSGPGAGSVFTVYLPRADDASEVDETEAPNVPRGNHERVLVVDDEEPLMRLATETLEDFGYRPVGFTSSLAALEAFRADPLAFDAVITDERMPGMTGSTLVRELRRMRATIPVMLMSGFVGGAVASGAREAGADEVLKKPLSGPDLVASLARVLQRGRIGVH